MFEQKADCIDVAIVGAGPAGLQAGIAMRDKGLSFVILERGPSVASFFRQFPRQRNLISINKVHTGLSDPEAQLRYDWNSLLAEGAPRVTQQVKRYFPKADEYVAYLEEFAGLLEDQIETDCNIVNIAKPNGVFELTAEDGRLIRARQVIAATGVTLPWLPEIQGLEETELYHDYDANPERFTDKRVLILGKGNSGFETAESLIEHAQAIHVMSPNKIKFAWNTHFVGHLRAVNTNFLDTYQLKSQNAVLDADPVKIERVGDVLRVTANMQAAKGHQIVLDYDHVITCTGFRFDASIFAPSIRPTLRRFGKFPAMTSKWEAEGVPGLWFAGTLMQCRDFKKTMSGFVHGFRHNIMALAEFVAHRATGRDLPLTPVPSDPLTLAHYLRSRASTNAALFLQPGFLADIIYLDGARAHHSLKAMPLDWARDCVLQHGRALTLTLEFGQFGANPLHVEREHTLFGDTPDAFIHPVLRYWQDGEVAATMHLADHLDADWRPSAERDPGAGTVQAMTYTDAGETLPPHDAALRQITEFLDRISLPTGLQRATAAE